MRTHSSHFASRGRRGQAGLFVVLNLTLVFGTLGLAVDIGWAYYTRQQAQTAADAAAMAAASYASTSGAPVCGVATICNSTATACNNPPTTPPTTNLQAGCLYAQSNGFVNDGTTQFVTLSGNTTAPGVSGNSPNYWVKATVTAKPYTLFGSFGGVSRFTINASATAAVSYFSAGACIYVLDPTASQAFTASGNTHVTATCGIFVNSSASNAFTANGSANVTATQILVNGGASIGGTVSPSPTIHAGTQADPLASLAMPTFSNTCDHTGYSLSSTPPLPLEHGIYCNGITIQGGGHATFNPGLYIVNGGGVTFQGGSTVSGTGVTFFITGQYAGHTIGPVTMSGSSVVNLSAPDSGPDQGMLFLQDRNLSYSGQNTISGSSSSVLSGTLYFPTTAVNYTGGSNTGSYTALIAKTATFSGNSAFKNDPTGTYTGLASTVRGLIQ